MLSSSISERGGRILIAQYSTDKTDFSQQNLQKLRNEGNGYKGNPESTGLKQDNPPGKSVNILK